MAGHRRRESDLELLLISRRRPRRCLLPIWAWVRRRVLSPIRTLSRREAAASAPASIAAMTIPEVTMAAGAVSRNQPFSGVKAKPLDVVA